MELNWYPTFVAGDNQPFMPIVLKFLIWNGIDFITILNRKKALEVVDRYDPSSN